MAQRTRGFFKGLLAGVAIGLAAAAVVAYLNPIKTLPPDIEPGATAPPPAAPAATARPDAPPATPDPAAGPQTLVRQGTGAPLISERPPGEMPPDLPGLAPPAVDAFADEPAGSPSLFPGDGEAR